MKCLSYNYNGSWAFKVIFEDAEEWMAFEEWFMNVGKDLFEEAYQDEQNSSKDTDN